MPSTPCLHAGCGELSVRLGRCASHAATYDQAIPRAGRAIYKTKRWQVLRKRRLFLESICRWCGEAIATEVDHIVPLVDGGLPFALGNTQSLCKPCHSAKTRGEQRAKAHA